MKFQISNFKLQIRHLLHCCSFTILIFFSLQPLAFTADRWLGVDESVVEKYAEEHGRKAREPIINTDKGDLLLFMFLLGGAAGGFAAGYYWKMLLTEPGRQRAGDRLNTGDG